MFEVRDAGPTWAADPEAVDPDEAGPVAMPSPTASPISGTTNAAYVHDASTNASAANPAVASTKPNAMARPPPTRAARGVMSGVIAIMPAAAGSVASPAWNALSPRVAGSWK